MPTKRVSRRRTQSALASSQVALMEGGPPEKLLVVGIISKLLTDMVARNDAVRAALPRLLEAHTAHWRLGRPEPVSA